MGNEVITENAVKNAIIDYLTLTGWLVIRINSGAATSDDNGKRRFVSFVKWFCGGYGPQTTGVADILAVKDGIYLAVECKRPGGGRLSDAQRRFLGEWGEHGGIWCVAQSLDDVILALPEGVQ